MAALGVTQTGADMVFINDSVPAFASGTGTPDSTPIAIEPLDTAAQQPIPTSASVSDALDDALDMTGLTGGASLAAIRRPSRRVSAHDPVRPIKHDTRGRLKPGMPPEHQ